MQKKNGIIVYQFTVNLCTLLAFILQCMPIPDKYKFLYNVFVFIVAILLIISIAISILSRNVYTRKKLMKTTQKIMSNAESVVMFGGDLTWAEDYEQTIKELTGNNKKVDIVFPKTKVNSVNQQANIDFEKNINVLLAAGANVFYTNEDTGLRCTFINVGAFDIHQVDDTDDLKIITSKRMKRNLKNGMRNKYRVNIYGAKKSYEKPLCLLYFKYYSKIQSDLCKYDKEVIFNG